MMICSKILTCTFTTCDYPGVPLLGGVCPRNPLETSLIFRPHTTQAVLYFGRLWACYILPATPATARLNRSNDLDVKLLLT
jgi:hypothetical protein